MCAVSPLVATSSPLRRHATQPRRPACCQPSVPCHLPVANLRRRWKLALERLQESKSFRQNVFVQTLSARRFQISVSFLNLNQTGPRFKTQLDTCWKELMEEGAVTVRHGHDRLRPPRGLGGARCMVQRNVPGR